MILWQFLFFHKLKYLLPTHTECEPFFLGFWGFFLSFVCFMAHFFILTTTTWVLIIIQFVFSFFSPQIFFFISNSVKAANVNDHI